MMLNVGWIDYANCTPLLLQIAGELDDAGIALTHGVPAQLNAALACGAIDVCVSSSIEVARHAEDYAVLSGHCIGSDGPVQSVLLLSNRPVQELAGERLLVTAESATSVVLLQILLTRYWRLPEYRIESSGLSWDKALACSAGTLVIGDMALQAAIAGTASFCYDLGAAWRSFTGLPFVFALWQVNRDAAVGKGATVSLLMELLNRARDTMPEKLRLLADAAGEARWMGADRLADYWRHITYRLDERHQEGLAMFFLLAAELGLIPGVPELAWIRN